MEIESSEIVSPDGLWQWDGHRWVPRDARDDLRGPSASSAARARDWAQWPALVAAASVCVIVVGLAAVTSGSASGTTSQSANGGQGTGQGDSASALPPESSDSEPAIPDQCQRTQETIDYADPAIVSIADMAYSRMNLQNPAWTFSDVAQSLRAGMAGAYLEQYYAYDAPAIREVVQAKYILSREPCGTIAE